MNCKVENCGRKLFTSGLCRTHHRWWKNGKDLSAEPRVVKYGEEVAYAREILELYADLVDGKKFSV